MHMVSRSRAGGTHAGPSTVPYVDKVKSVKTTRGFPTEVSDMARNMKIELLTFSLYCISRKTVDTDYTYYS